MTYLAILLGIPVLVVFLLLSPRIKALLSFVLMMRLFDVVPNLLFGLYLWDYGAVLMLITGIDVYFFRKAVVLPVRHPYITAMRIFLAWLIICFAWSVFVYQYPVMHTIKNARSMIVGYSVTLILIRLFSVDPDSFRYMVTRFYWITFALMPVMILQYLINKPLLFGLVSEYEGSIRAVPVYISLCLLNLWVIFGKFFSSERLRFHEQAYAVLVLATITLTFTRGLYAVTIFGTSLLIVTMFLDNKVVATSVVGAVIVGSFLIALLLATGVADKVAGRAISGLAILGSSEHQSSANPHDNTFSGRLGLAEERLSLVWERNPLLGFGFIHEDDVPSELREHLHFGTALTGTATDPTLYSRSYEFSSGYILGFYTADIAWADIAISTGLVGVILLCAMVVIFILEHYLTRSAVHPLGYAMRAAIFVQITVLFVLTLDSNNFYGEIQIPAFLFAGYSLTRQLVKNTVATRTSQRFANLIG